MSIGEITPIQILNTGDTPLLTPAVKYSQILVLYLYIVLAGIPCTRLSFLGRLSWTSPPFLRIITRGYIPPSADLGQLNDFFLHGNLLNLRVYFSRVWLHIPVNLTLNHIRTPPGWRTQEEGVWLRPVERPESWLPAGDPQLPSHVTLGWRISVSPRNSAILSPLWCKSDKMLVPFPHTRCNWY